MNTRQVAWIEERIRKVLSDGPLESRVVQRRVKQRNSTAGDYHRALNHLLSNGAVEHRDGKLHLLDDRPAKTLMQFRYNL